MIEAKRAGHPVASDTHKPPVDAGMTTQTFAGITKCMVTKQRNVDPTANLCWPRKTRKLEGNDDEPIQ